MKKTKNAKSSINLVESLMCSKKQKWLYDPGKIRRGSHYDDDNLLSE